jgi:hypothetical protein
VDTDLAITAPTVVPPGDTYTVSGSLSQSNAALPNTQVEVTRSINGGVPSTIGFFTTDASGAFSFTDSCSTASTASYTATDVAMPALVDSVTLECIPVAYPIAPAKPKPVPVVPSKPKSATVASTNPR